MQPPARQTLKFGTLNKYAYQHAKSFGRLIVAVGVSPPIAPVLQQVEKVISSFSVIFIVFCISKIHYNQLFWSQIFLINNFPMPDEQYKEVTASY